MYRTKRETGILISIIRIVVALVFILSGFLKGVDPWGTAIKIGDYFQAFGMEWLSGGKYVFSILLSSLEMWLGLLLLFNLLPRFSRLLVMLFMVFFTILTLIIALTDPVADCGCFGDAIKLTNWQTFWKNVVLLPLSIILLAHLKKENPCEPRRGIAALLFLLSVAPGISAIYSLPWIDFLPYREGVNIRESMTIPEGMQGESRTTLIYKNLHTGENREFEVSDTTWYDSQTWEFVDTRVEVLRESYVPVITDFAIFNREQAITDEILEADEAFLLIADKLEYVNSKDAIKYRKAAEYAFEHNIRVICLTTSTLDLADNFDRKTGISIPCYNIDATTLQTMLRAHKGLIILSRGTIVAKMNLNDLPDFEESAGKTATGYILASHKKAEETGVIALYAVLILLLLFCRCSRCKK